MNNSQQSIAQSEEQNSKDEILKRFRSCIPLGESFECEVTEVKVPLRWLGLAAAEVERLRLVFDEACNEVKMSHGKPCFCKYCHEPKESS